MTMQENSTEVSSVPAARHDPRPEDVSGSRRAALSEYDLRFRLLVPALAREQYRERDNEKPEDHQANDHDLRDSRRRVKAR